MGRHRDFNAWAREFALWIGLGCLWAQGPAPDPRAVALVGATSTIAQGIHAVGFNPARLAFSTKNFSMNLGALTFGLENNMLSVENYNLVNGADFIDPISPDFVDKNEFLEGLPVDGLRLKTRLHLPIPGINWARGTTAFSSDVIIFGDLGFPKALFELLMQGNLVGDSLKLDLNEEVLGVAEWGFSFAVPAGNVAYGFTLKYLQGLFYVGIDPDSSSGFFSTDPAGFNGSGRYLLRRAVGGSGFGLDIGLASAEVNGYSFGISLINALGSIRWQGPSLTKDLFGDRLEAALGFRDNEYFLYTYRVSNVTATEFLQDLPLDSLFENESFAVVDTEDGLVRSDTLTDKQFDAVQTTTPFVIKYPALLRLGFSKRFEDTALLTAELVAGFQDRLWSSQGWQLAVGVEIVRSPRFPLRMGFRYGGAESQQLGVGFGLYAGPLQFDFAMAFHNGVWLHTTKGISLALGLTLVR